MTLSEEVNPAKFGLSDLLLRFQEFGNAPAVHSEGVTITYSELLYDIGVLEEKLSSKIERGSICSFFGDFSRKNITLIFALMKLRVILVPLSHLSSAEYGAYKNIAGITHEINGSETSNFEVKTIIPPKNPSPYYEELRKRDAPGLVVFSSGSTGQPKGIVQDCDRVIQKFHRKRKDSRTLLFLLMDHFGGFNTLLSILSSGGLAVCPPNRSPTEVVQLIEELSIQILPATPSFLKMMLDYKSIPKEGLKSLKLITYGTEAMSENLLQKLNVALPNVTFKQTYGLSELGVMPTLSAKNDSTLVKLGGEGFEYRVVEGILWIKAFSSMLGYLNADYPFDESGWFCTGDIVEEENGFIRFVGRNSETINIGGQKVLPVEIENVLEADPNVLRATVKEACSSLGLNFVEATIELIELENHRTARGRLRKLCLQHLSKFKVPSKFYFREVGSNLNARFKKVRKI